MRAGIALGSNLGNRATQMAGARDFIFALHEGSDAPLCSALYETEPLGCAAGTPAFFNAVVEIETHLEPLHLLERLHRYETESGRAPIRPRNSPREIDLDLLYAGAVQMATGELVLPHPRMTSRLFVLRPLADIRADLILPGQTMSVAQLLSGLPAAPAARLVTTEW